MSDRTNMAWGTLAFIGLPILGAADNLAIPLGFAGFTLIVWWMVFSRDKRR